MASAHLEVSVWSPIREQKTVDRHCIASCRRFVSLSFVTTHVLDITFKHDRYNVTIELSANNCFTIIVTVNKALFVANLKAHNDATRKFQTSYGFCSFLIQVLEMHFFVRYWGALYVLF